MTTRKSSSLQILRLKSNNSKPPTQLQRQLGAQDPTEEEAVEAKKETTPGDDKEATEAGTETTPKKVKKENIKSEEVDSVEEAEEAVVETLSKEVLEELLEVTEPNALNVVETLNQMKIQKKTNLPLKRSLLWTEWPQNTAKN